MKTTKKLKSEISEKIHSYDFNKSQLKLINKYIDMIIDKGYNVKMTSFEEYMLSLDYGKQKNPKKIGVVFEYKSKYFPFSFTNIKGFQNWILVDKMLLEKYDVSENEFKETLNKVLIMKGFDIELYKFKVSIVK